MKLVARIKSVALAAIAAVTLGCASSAPVDYDSSVNFQALKTYSWLDSKALESDDPRISNTLFNDRVKAAVDRELARKGFVKSEGEVDFKVVYHLSIDRKIREDNLNAHYGYYPYGWGYRHPMYVDTSSRIREYDEGTLIVDVVDPAAERLWWRGSHSATVRKSTGPEKATQRVNDAVARIMANYPPGVK